MIFQNLEDNTLYIHIGITYLLWESSSWWYFIESRQSKKKEDLLS